MSPTVLSSESNDSLRQAQGLSLSKAAESDFEGKIHLAQSFLNRQNTLFDIGRSMFDVRRSSLTWDSLPGLCLLVGYKQLFPHLVNNIKKLF